MNLRSLPVTLCATIIGCGLLWPQAAHPSLGGDRASVAEDARILHGVIQSSATGTVEMQQITTDGGLQVREYLTPGGVVFALGWNGPVMPELKPLLGSSFEPYAAALRAQDHAGRHRAFSVVSSALVVASEGHLRAYSGRAYLPALLPAGVSPGLLQ